MKVITEEFLHAMVAEGKKKIENLVRKIHVERRKTSLLNDKIRKRFEE